MYILQNDHYNKFKHSSLPIVTIFFLDENFQIYFLSNFQTYNTVLLTAITSDTRNHHHNQDGECTLYLHRIFYGGKLPTLKIFQFLISIFLANPNWKGDWERHYFDFQQTGEKGIECEHWAS